MVRRSWRSVLRTGRFSRRRVLRTVFAMAVLALAVWLIALLVLPFLHPQTHLFLLTATQQRPLGGSTLDYVDNDVSAFLAMAERTARHGSVRTPVHLDNLQSQAAMGRLSEDLERSLSRSSDILILYVCTNGTTEDGKAYLSCDDYQVSTASAARYSLEDFIECLAGCPAAVKFVILDIGRSPYDPRLGTLAEELPRLLRDQVEEAKDPALWVLSSNAKSEASRVSRSLERSFFAYFVTRGLEGSADLDGDRHVSVDELHRYVASRVDAAVQTATEGRTSQVPELLWGGKSAEHDKAAEPLPSPVLVTVGPRQKETEAVEMSGAIDAAQKTSRLASYYGVGRAPSGSQLMSGAASRILPSGRVGSLLYREGSRLPSSGGLAPAAAGPAEGSSPAGGGDGSPPLADSGGDAGDGDADSGGDDAAASGSDAAAADSAEGGESPEGSAQNAGATDAERAAAAAAAANKRAASLLDEAWELYETIATRAGDEDLPVDFAPHLWAELQRRLQFFDGQFRAGGELQQGFGDALEDFTRSLRLLAQGEQVTGGSPDSVVRRIDDLRFTDWPDGSPAYSLGLAEMLAQRRQVPLAAELAALIEAIDAFLEDGADSAEFQKWTKESLTVHNEAFGLFRLARRLADESEVDWEDKQQALQTMRLGERVAASCMESLPWVQAKIETADRRRLEGQRILFDRIGDLWPDAARRRLLEATEIYREALAEGEQIIAIRCLTNELVSRSRGYLDWRWASGGAPSTATPAYGLLKDLFDTLADTITLLDRPEPSRLEELRHMHSRLVDLQERIDSGMADAAVAAMVGDPGDAWKIEGLLTTALPSPVARRTLLAGAAEAEAQRMRRVAFPKVGRLAPTAQNTSKKDWQRVRLQLDLERRRAQLAMPSRPPAVAYDQWDELLVACERFERAFDSPESEGPTPEDIALVTQALRAFYEALPQQIQKTAGNGADLSDPASRIRELRQAMRQLRCLDGRDAPAMEALDLNRMLRQVEIYDHFAWERQRVLSAREDARSGEAQFLTDAARTYRQMAAAFDSQPQLPADLPIPFALEGPAEISLTDAAQADFVVRLRNPGSLPLNVWIILHYDPNVLHVESSDKGTVYAQAALAADLSLLRGQQLDTGDSSDAGESAALEHQRRAERLRFSAQYPYHPDEFPSLSPTLTVAVLEQESVTLHLKRLQVAMRPARLIVKAIAAPVEGPQDCSYLRHMVDVDLPTSESIALEIRGTQGTWTETQNEITLQPFPNRTTAYEFRLRNRSRRKKEIGIQLLASDRTGVVSMPTGALSEDDAKELLERFAPTSVLVPEFTASLPAGDEPVALPFPVPGASDVLPADAAGGGDDQTAEDAPAEAPSTGGGDAAEKTPLPATLLVVMTDRETGRMTVRRLRPAVQRPRHFLRPRVGYDPERERIEIRVAAMDPQRLPDGDVQIQARFSGDVLAGKEIELDAAINKQRPEAVMYASMPAARERVVGVQLHIDGYPRAFVYEVPCWAQVADVSERVDLMKVRVTSLPDGQVYKTPVGSIPVEVEVDVPIGSFDNPDDHLYVGIDEDRDRELVGDPRIALHADRQVAMHLEELGPGGQVRISSQVSNFRVFLPAASRRSMRAAVLAELSVAERTAWSESREIVFDGTPPRVYQPRLRPGRDVAPGGEIELSVLAGDDDLSGVATVEAAIDARGSGKFSEDAPPVAAERNPETGVWVAKLPTAELAPGSYELLMRATDAVGNVGEYASVDINIMSAEAAEAGKFNRVMGTVQYNEDVVGGAEVKLEGAEDMEIPAVSTNDQGEFLFPKVPAGSYKISARALIHNKYRNSTAELEVAAPPAKAAVIQLHLRQRGP